MNERRARMGEKGEARDDSKYIEATQNLRCECPNAEIRNTVRRLTKVEQDLHDKVDESREVPTYISRIDGVS